MSIVPVIHANRTARYLLKLDKFRGGTNTLVNPARLAPHFAAESNNLWQVQDGIWKTRPGTDYYGTAIPGVTSIDGAAEYIKTDGTRQIIAVGGGYAWSSEDGGTWTQLTGATFTAGKRCYFIQIGNKLLIANGTDDLAYYDGTNLNVYSALTAPSAPTLSLTGLTTGAYNNYYRIVAVNTIGYTEASPSTSTTTSKQRADWDTSNYVTVSWTAVTGATGYQVYWGEFDGQETLIAETTGTSIDDFGESTYPHNPYIETPDDNTTSAPKFKSMVISGNRLWATNDSNNPWRVYFTGTGQYFTTPAFSPFYGGGWIDLEKGGKNKPLAVTHYRTGKGTPIPTVLCSSGDGNGTIFQIDLVSVSIGSETATVPSAAKVVGSVGTDAVGSVTKVLDNVFYANKKGIYALRNKQQMFNVLSNDDVTVPIRNKYEGISQSKIGDIVGYYHAPRLYLSLSVGGSSNDTTIIFDMERNNWNWGWTVGFNQFFEYTDNSGKTHFLGVLPTGDKLAEISENFEGDFGEAFYQSYISPLFPVSKDYTMQAKLRYVIVELGKLRGSLTVEVLGMSKDKQLFTVGTKTVTATTGTTGWSDDFFSNVLFSDTHGTPSVFAEDTTKKKVDIGDKLYAIQFKIWANNKDTQFELLGIQADGYLMPGRAPSTWD